MALILFLHGASSSGKSSLASAIRQQARRPFLHLSIDHLRDIGAWRPEDYPDWAAARPAFFEGFHRAAAAFADAGNDLIFEHILDTSGWHGRLQELFKPHEVLFAGLHVPLDMLNRREAQRGNRAAGSAAADFTRIHTGLNYDLELDGTLPPAENAAHILRAIRVPRKRLHFFT